MDLNTVHCLAGDSRYFSPVEDGEFCVVDTVTREKAWFEWLPSMDAEAVRQTIEGHFAAAAFRITSRIWAV
ncbi:hypothetical protein RAE21_06310 [Rhodoferax sp. TBRC 17198]|uniref:hypothetical protein n=1 Tax=Rhodoferax potami TaxID=3068338 RepID=UPI0028BED589|nr:hypothetical protein [Rhodoferax sp. TBRC 17198]MDT7522024.1 hypothetical protein [Rhodoferax sp. TBRC 17198]